MSLIIITGAHLATVVVFLAHLCVMPCRELSQVPAVTGNPCIARIIGADDSLGTIRNHACEQISLAETIRNYTESLAALDFSGCPKTFDKAFRKHRFAWENMIPFVENFPDHRGEMHDLFDLFEKGPPAAEFKPLLDAIWDTWADIEATMKS